MPLNDTSRLCIHTITTKPWSIETSIKQYAAAGVKGMTVWRQALENRNPTDVGQQIREAGLSVTSLCRGGFFPGLDTKSRQAALDDNRRAIDEAAALGAPLVVLVCGATPMQSLADSRQQIQDGIAALLPHAEACQVKLGIEPLHPMYADSRSAINTMKQANDMAEALNSPMVGVVIDTYHLWWDPDLSTEIARCGQAGNILAFHISDWRTPTEDLLNDRGLMGDGCIPNAEIRQWVEAAGFDGFIEVEIFSDRHWAEDQQSFLQAIKSAYLQYA
ncbi:MAG: sugar phosphate isomerase/epimerase family protein [Chloroflexota bacterium]